MGGGYYPCRFSHASNSFILDLFDIALIVEGCHLSDSLLRKIALSLVPAALALTSMVMLPLHVEARKHASSKTTVKSTVKTTRSSGRTRTTRRGGRVKEVAQSPRGKRGSRQHQAVVARGKHHVRHAVAHAAPKTRYAYPIGIFMRNPPSFDRTPLDAQNANNIASAFESGSADVYAARVLVRAGVVKYHPLRGGIFWRREPVKYIIMHSTETGVPVPAVNVIESWSSMGIRHPGAQYVVERDGTIYQAVDPDLATVHINIFKTLPGINNDNSIGIEMCHTGSQNYPQAQLRAVTRLVGYLQNRYNVADDNIITHRYAQQGDHTDPVNFDWNGFIASKNSFRNQAIAYRSSKIKDEAKKWKREVEVPINTYMKPHTQISKPVPSNVELPVPEIAAPPVERVAPRLVPAVIQSNYGPAPVAAPSTPAPSVNTPAPSNVKPPTNDLKEVPVPEPSQADPARNSEIPRAPLPGETL